MRVTGTTHGDKSQNLGLVQLQGFRRSQIVRCQNNRNIRVDSSVHNTQQIIQNPLGHILDVRSTSLHICIIHSCKHSCKLDACLFHGVFCITGFFINQRCNTRYKVFIFHKHGMGFKEDCHRLTGIFLALFCQGIQLPDGLFLSNSQAGFFGLNIRDNFQRNRGVRTLEEIEGAFCNALGYTFTLDCNHSSVSFLYVERSWETPKKECYHFSASRGKRI